MFDYVKLSKEIEKKFGFKFSPQELGYLNLVASAPSPAGSVPVYAVTKGDIMITVKKFSGEDYSLSVVTFM